MSIRPRAVGAVFRRNFSAYFGSPTGYVFITIFIVAGAYLAFSTAGFFAVNLADLSSLNALFHWLLILFIPAITMGAWADEQRLGTDELLFTLPLRDVEIVLGKFLAAAGVYTVALLFALSHAFVLAWLGDPDWGLIAANYIGYWVMGSTLITVGLVASALTGHVTVAFILGTAFCLVLTFTQDVLAVIPGVSRDLAERVGVLAHFRNFTLGVISLPDVLYFAVLSTVMLYINLVLVARRHWRWGREGQNMGWQYLARTVCVIVGAFAFGILAGRWFDGVRLDVTAEGLNTISEATRQLLKELPEDRPVYIQAFVSPDVPREYVATRQDLLRVLREFDAIAGTRLVVRINDTQLYSDEARTAEERFDIRPVDVPEMTEGRIGQRKIFMGVAVTSGAGQDVIPFLDRGLSVEYELARSVRVVSGASRRKIGVLKTDAQLFGGFEMSVMQVIPAWPFVDELRKQYDVREVELTEEMPEDVDVLVAALPSSLTQFEMDRLADYLQSGRPTLLLVDPAPMVFPNLSPSQPKRPTRGRFGAQPAPEEKGDFAGLLAQVGLAMTRDEVVWHAYNPLPKLRDLPLE
ncbi:MAG TPA: Gldg family protein, partial [Planctomycetota bacterium]|nr:Gldg family protein [Planctomycetota bacterium]